MKTNVWADKYIKMDSGSVMVWSHTADEALQCTVIFGKSWSPLSPSDSNTGALVNIVNYREIFSMIFLCQSQYVLIPSINIFPPASMVHLNTWKKRHMTIWYRSIVMCNGGLHTTFTQKNGVRNPFDSTTSHFQNLSTIRTFALGLFCSPLLALDIRELFSIIKEWVGPSWHGCVKQP